MAVMIRAQKYSFISVIVKRYPQRNLSLLVGSLWYYHCGIITVGRQYIVVGRQYIVGASLPNCD